MSLTTVSSASLFNNIPRVFGLGRAASPPPSPPTRDRGRKPLSSSRKRQSPPADSTPLETRGRSRRPGNGKSRTGNGTPRTGNNTPRTPASPPRQSRRPSRQPQQRPRPRPRSISTISTLSSLLPAPPPDDESVYEPPAPSWRASLRALEKSNKTPSERVDAWRLGVAAAVPPEVGNNEAASTAAGTSTAVPSVAEGTRTESTRDTEITDSQGIGSLTDEEIFALTQNIKNEEASRRPLVSPISSLAELRAEFSPFADVLGTPGTGEVDYAGPNANVLRKIDWLRKHGGWLGIRRTRGDGDCFYRSLAFAYVEKIMTAADPGLAVATALSHLESTLPLLEQAGFQKIVFEDFYEAFADVIQQVVPKTGKLPLTNESLLEQFQDPEISNSIVVFLRLLTSSYIRLSPEDDFTPFLIHPDTGEMIDVRTFVETFVEATGREAGKFPPQCHRTQITKLWTTDHPQIMALSKALRVRIEVAYLDNSTGTPLEDGTLRIDFVKFAPDGAEEDGTSPVVLLYRPGHYDTLEEKVET